MSLIKSNAVQIGQSGTATYNFTLAVPSSPDGTIKLARGNSGATTQDVLSVSNTGVVSFPQGLGNISNGTAIATGSTTARSLANRFADVVNVLDFGADPTGVTDSTTAFQNALNVSDDIFAPKGTYLINSSITANNKHIILQGSITGTGNLGNAIVTNFKGRSLAVGRNGNNAGANWQGLQIGGADTTYGGDGVFLGNDENSSWLRFQPTKNYSPIELVVYSTSAQGRATATFGTNQITYIFGSSFDSSWVGKILYFGENIYTVASVAVNVISLNDAFNNPFIFSSTYTETFQFGLIQGSGICNASGTSVTRVTGDPFIIFNSAITSFKINGVEQKSNISSITDGNNLILTSPIATLNGVLFSFEAQINHQLSTFRLQKVFGINEENLSIFARYDGYWIHSLISGSGSHRKIVFGSGTRSSGELARQIVALPNGDLSLGGDSTDCAFKVLNETGGNSNNRFEVKAASSGLKPSLRARGSDTNVGIGFDTKGNGEVAITQDFARTLMKVQGGGSTVNWLNLAASSASNPVTISVDALSSDTNVDISLVPKGTGVLKFGSHTTSSDVPITGYIAIKDASGVSRKLAVIA